MHRNCSSRAHTRDQRPNCGRRKPRVCHLLLKEKQLKSLKFSYIFLRYRIAVLNPTHFPTLLLLAARLGIPLCAACGLDWTEQGLNGLDTVVRRHVQVWLRRDTIRAFLLFVIFSNRSFRNDNGRCTLQLKSTRIERTSAPWYIFFSGKAK